MTTEKSVCDLWDQDTSSFLFKEWTGKSLSFLEVRVFLLSTLLLPMNLSISGSPKTICLSHLGASGTGGWVRSYQNIGDARLSICHSPTFSLFPYVLLYLIEWQQRNLSNFTNYLNSFVFISFLIFLFCFAIQPRMPCYLNLMYLLRLLVRIFLIWMTDSFEKLGRQQEHVLLESPLCFPHD